jgi:hypothetical protein
VVLTLGVIDIGIGVGVLLTGDGLSTDGDNGAINGTTIAY